METKIELLERRLRECTEHAERQRGIVRGIRERGEDPVLAEALLLRFEESIERYKRELKTRQTRSAFE